MTSLEEIGSRLRLERIRIGLNQEELADKTAVHVNSVRKWEQGKNACNVTYLLILKDFGFDLGFVLNGRRGDGSLNPSAEMMIDMMSRISERERSAVMNLLATLSGATYDLEKIELNQSLHESPQNFRSRPKD